MMQANLIPGYQSYPDMQWAPALPTLGMLPLRQELPAAATGFSAQEQFMVSAETQMQMLAGELLALMTKLMLGSKSDSTLGATPVNGSAPAPTPSPSPVQGPSPVGDTMPGSTDFGKRLAQKAEATANGINTSGLCLKGVNDSMEAMGIQVHRRPSAYMALDDLRKDSHFQEVHVAKDKLDSLPAGAIVVWGKGNGLPDGHISVALGDGREASSKVCKQLHLSTEFHVFMPK